MVQYTFSSARNNALCTRQEQKVPERKLHNYAHNCMIHAMVA